MISFGRSHQRQRPLSHGSRKTDNPPHNAPRLRLLDIIIMLIRLLTVSMLSVYSGHMRYIGRAMKSPLRRNEDDSSWWSLRFRFCLQFSLSIMLFDHEMPYGLASGTIDASLHLIMNILG